MGARRRSLETERGLEVDRLRNTIRDHARDPIPELVMLPGQAMVALGAAHGELVVEESLVAHAVFRDHHESLTKVPDRTRVRVPVVLPHAEDGTLDA